MKTKILIKTFVVKVAVAWSYIYSLKTKNKLAYFKNFLYTAWLSREFKMIEQTSLVKHPIKVIGGKHIQIGNKTVIGKNCVLSAFEKVCNHSFSPEIVIGNSVNIGDDSHITAVNKIIIGNNVLTGKKITITDNSHGNTTLGFLNQPPNERIPYSKGPVVIEDNVWIGDKATILPGVTIGKSAIIGANSVVTKDIPENAVAGGIPAKILKIIH